MSETKHFKHEGHVTLKGDHPEMKQKAQHPYNPTTYGWPEGSKEKTPEILSVTFPMAALVKAREPDGQECAFNVTIDIMNAEVYDSDGKRLSDGWEKAILDSLNTQMSDIPEDLYAGDDSMHEKAFETFEEYRNSKDSILRGEMNAG